MERCTRSPSSLSLKQNLIMFEMIDVTRSEVRGPATISHRNHYSWLIKDPLKKLWIYLCFLKASEFQYNSCCLPAMSCASCCYTYSPWEDVNQALNHLHILLLSCFSFQGPYSNCDLCSTPVHDQNNLPALLVCSHALLALFSPQISLVLTFLPPPWICSKAVSVPWASQNIWIPIHNVFTHCDPCFHACWGMARISMCCTGSQSSPRCLSSPTWKWLFWISRYALNNWNTSQKQNGPAGIHLVTKGTRECCQENQGNSFTVMQWDVPQAFSILIGTQSTCQRPSCPNSLRHLGSPTLKPFPRA